MYICRAKSDRERREKKRESMLAHASQREGKRTRVQATERETERKRERQRGKGKDTGRGGKKEGRSERDMQIYRINI